MLRPSAPGPVSVGLAVGDGGIALSCCELTELQLSSSSPATKPEITTNPFPTSDTLFTNTLFIDNHNTKVADIQELEPGALD
jgi:hypothetical protein